jgi:hypothetical protein
MPESREALLTDEGFAAVVAVGIVGCQWWIMDELRVPAQWAVPALATALIGALLFVWLLPGQQKVARARLRFGLVGVLVLANFVNLLALGAQAFFGAPPGAMELLFTGLVLWTMNVLVFALVYWVLDGGGPEARAEDAAVVCDFVFPQQTETESGPTRWRPAFGDYLYLGFTGAIAFGPTDAMPYSRRAKAAMTVEAAIALAVLGVVIARAVSLAGS